MEPDIARRLQNTDKERLVLLIENLATRHPQLLSEVTAWLDTTASFPISLPESNSEDDLETKYTEDWDFSRDTLVNYNATPHSDLLPLDIAAYQQKFAYFTSLESANGAQAEITQQLLNLLREAERRITYRDYHAALDLFALLIDIKLAAENTELLTLYDRAIDDAMPLLENLLGEVSSHILFDTTITLSPLLSSNARQEWLQRLFKLWLQRLDTYHVEEDIPEVILDVAWSDDVGLLRGLVLKELQYPGEHTNIVDLTRQYRVRALEKFLKELPHV